MRKTLSNSDSWRGSCCQLEFIFEVCNGAQPPQHAMGILGGDKIDEQAVEGDDLCRRHAPAQISPARHGSRGQKEALFSLVATATTTRSNSLAARSTRSTWPLVMGSKVPGYTTVWVNTAFVLQIVLSAYTSPSERTNESLLLRLRC